MTEAERDAFVEDKLACEHKKHIVCQERVANLQRSNDELEAEIQERKRAEEALKESEERYRSLFDSIDEGFCIIEVLFDEMEKPVDYRFLEINPSFERQTGLINAKGKRMRELAPKHEDHWFETYGKIALTGEPMRFQNRAEQLHRWYDVYAFRFGQPEKRQVAILFNDIIERKRAEKALLESEERFRAFVTASSDVVYRMSPDWSEMRHLQGREFIPDTCSPSSTWLDKYIHPEDQPYVLSVINEAIRTKGIFELEHRVLRVDGTLGWTFSRAVPLLDEKGEIAEWFGAAKDITERKKAEEDLRKAHFELEIRVQERTADLLNAKETAEEAVRVKAAFMANMSHELRTPMNSVIGFSSLLLEEKLTEEQRDHVESIRNSGQALMALINEVLDFSRMEKEKMDLELQTFDLRNIMEEALDMVASQAASKGLELIYTFDKTVPEAIIGDPGKLRQVLGNLLSNAVKFTKEGEVDVFVSSNSDQEEIHFVVKDTGTGIPPDDIGKLFQPFSQLDMSYSRGFEGTGLGLAISKKLVELMGGRIWVESVVGKGSTFHFTIPAETAPSDHKPFLTDSIDGKRMLIVEGNQTLRRILSRQIHAWGILPMMASNIREAVELLQRDNDFDAVIVDVSKDEALSTMVDKRDRWKKMPLIALASLGHEVPTDLFQAVLTKPLKPARLFNALLDVLEEREASEVEIPEMEKGYEPLRILLAEDNISNQKVTLEMLKKLGYRADAVVNGQEVLEALERHPYDIIFMDVKMPMMNGIEAARMIRERWPENGPKIIAVTAYALAGDKEKCLDAGMDDYIPKPVQKEDLAGVLNKYRSSKDSP